MVHGGGVAGRRLGAAEADRELGDPERIEKGETLLIAPLDVEREARARSGAVAAEDIGLLVVLQKAEIADALDLEVVAQEFAHLGGRSEDHTSELQYLRRNSYA